MALILPAITGARINARITAVAAEITQLDQAIATFKSQFQVEPPSSLNIPSQGAAWTTADMSKVRTIWPQFDFATRGGLDAESPIPPATNLSGAECLVFFLGGRQSGSIRNGIVTGFSKNPIAPWSRSGTNRVGPYFEFDAGRLVDVDSDGAFEYVDQLPEQETPYLYLSSQGKLYNKSNSPAQDDFDVYNEPPRILGDFSPSDPPKLNMSFPYLKTDLGTPHRSESYQIISSGLDHRYGIGGIYTNGDELKFSDFNADEDSVDVLDNAAGGTLVGVFDPADQGEERGYEADNITNFSGGTLKP